MTIKEAILTLNANAVIACERAGFDYATVKMIEDALDTIEDVLKAQEPCVDAVSREAVLDLAQTYGPATYDMPYGSGDMIIRPEDVETLPSVQPTPLARVMTLEEARSAYVVEYRSGKMREIGSALLDININPLNALYGKIYRVWTSRPTDEQMEAEPWN